MKYKMGDRVKVRKDLKASKTYGELTLYALMYDILKTNPICTISRTFTENGSTFYNIEEDERSFAFSEQMFSGIVGKVSCHESKSESVTRPEPSRLEIAAMAMMGILGSGTYKGTPNQLSFICTEYADALIKEFKPQEDNK